MKRFKRAFSVLLCGLLCSSTVLAAAPAASAADGEGEPWQQPNTTHLVSVLGWEGDKDAAIAYSEGSFWIRDGKDVTVGFHIADGVESLQWYNAEEFLPCLITEFTKDGCKVQIKNFGDKVTVDGHDYVAIYSRVSITNNTGADVTLNPGASPEFLSLTPDANETVAPGETVNHDFVVAIDRFGHSDAHPDWEGEKYGWPEDGALIALGGWNDHYRHMKDYWLERIEGIAQIEQLPDEQMKNAYYATFIQYNIIKDPYQKDASKNDIIVGENGYDLVARNDQLEMIASMLQFGETKDIQHNLVTSLGEADPGANWKMAWPWAVYLLKTGDKDFVRENYTALGTRVHAIETDRTGPGGVMAESYIDTWGSWTMGNWNALMGLLSYEYISKELGNTKEAEWAAALYIDLKKACDDKLLETMSNHSLDYIPADILQPNSKNRTGAANDANWAVHLFNGRWPWEGYLIGADQDGPMKDYIDSTYDFGLGRLKGMLPECDFGAYPGYSTGYNASYGSSALLGERYRSVGIYAYQFILQNTQNGPYSWWESLKEAPTEEGAGAWDAGLRSNSYIGSCPHMWGQITANKMLMDSIISEKYDHTLIVGRGIPNEWLAEGKVTEVKNYPSGGKRVGVKIEGIGNNQVKLTMLGDTPSGSIQFDLPLFLNGNLESATAGTVDKEAGSVILPADTKEVIVTVKSLAAEELTDGKYEAENAELSGVSVTANTKELEVSGTGYVDMAKTDGNSAAFTVNVPKAGEYVMITRYANANAADATVSLSVNGGKSQMTLPAGTQDDWNEWNFHAQMVSLGAGDNTIKLLVNEGDTAAFYLDYIRIGTALDEALMTLRKTVNSANEKDRLYYTAESYRLLETALTEAKNLIAKPEGLSLEQISKMVLRVKDAVNNLVQVDDGLKSAIDLLRKKLQDVKPYTENRNYPAAQRLIIKKAMAAGNALLVNPEDLTVEKLNGCIQKIDKAIDLLTVLGGTRYEAEDGTLTGGASIDDSHTHSGSGYVNTGRREGYGVEIMVNIPAAGDYHIIARVCNANGESAFIQLSVDGEVKQDRFRSESDNWDDWVDNTVAHHFDAAGEYMVKFVCTEYYNGMAIDYVDVVPLEAADKETLMDAILAAEALDEGKYTLQSFEAVKDALTAANTVLNNLSATEQEVTDAAAALSQAMNGLESYLKSLLKETIDAAQEAKKNYPEHLIEAVKVKFEAALAEAISVYGNADATDEQIMKADDALINMMHYLSFTADPEGLQKAIAHAEEIVASGKYVQNDEMNAYKEALKAAQELLKDEFATDTEYNTKILALQTAEKALTLKPEVTLNLKVLEHQLGLTELINLDDYLNGAAKDAFNAAYDKAKDIYAKALNQDESITQAAVNKAAEELHSALINLRLVPSKDKLQKLLEEANAKDLAKYTKESCEALKAAIANAQSVYDDPRADIDMVKSAEGVLQAALDNLVPIKNGGNTPSGGDTPTGDSTPFALLSLLCALTFAGVLALRKRCR